jgi:hypothetical protein
MCGAMHCKPSGCSAAASSCVAPWYEKPYMPMRPLQAGMSAQPGDRLRAVAAFVAKGIELAIRAAAAAHILNDDVIAVAREPHGCA